MNIYALSIRVRVLPINPKLPKFGHVVCATPLLSLTLTLAAINNLFLPAVRNNELYGSVNTELDRDMSEAVTIF